MQEIAKKILLTNRWFSSQDNPIITTPCEGVWEFAFEDGPTFIVCNEEGEENILNEYRQASIDGAKHDIPEVYHDFFEFNDFADYSWQTLYDVYDDVDELFDEAGNKWFVCSL